MKLGPLLCLPLAACFTIDDNEDGPPAGQPYCGDGTVDSNEQCDDGNSIAGDGCTLCARDGAEARISATWHFKSLATNTTTGCPTGFDTVALYQQRVDVDGLPVGTPFIDLFDCSAMSGTNAPIVPAKYETWIEVTNASNTSVYATSPSVVVDVSATDKRVDFEILNDGGYVQLRWALLGETSGSTLTCAQAGAQGGIFVGLTETTSSQQTNDIFACSDAATISPGVLLGTYVVGLSAFDVSNSVLGLSDTYEAIIDRPNKVVDLGTITIRITGQ